MACQEFYDSSYNYVGIISFPGLNLENKVITEIWLDIDAEKAGYGVKNTKTVSLRKANYQDDIASGGTGGQYVGDELGTFEGAFYGNYNGYHITGPLFDAMAAYISDGNNSFTIYNPSATASPSEPRNLVPVSLADRHFFRPAHIGYTGNEPHKEVIL